MKAINYGINYKMNIVSLIKLVVVMGGLIVMVWFLDLTGIITGWIY